MYAGAKGLFFALSRSRWLKQLASRYGMTESGFARRFIAGEAIADVLVAARAVQAEGYLLTLDYLGESVSTVNAAEAATREYVRLMGLIVEAGVERNISLKLTQLGITIDRATCVDNMRRILEPGRKDDFFVRIDMEDSEWTEVTLQIFETLWQQEYRNVGVVLQSALYRSETDVDWMNDLGARVRLVKGAYKEPSTVAHQQKADVDAAYLRIMRKLIERGTYPAIATHDPAMIDATRAYATERGLKKDAFEFQMLYGIRRDLQEGLLADGYRVRLYVPFGREWFPYFMRRLGERPANVAFVLKSLFRER